MSIYITRHGQTNWNIERRFQGRTDNKLNENGINQAHEVAEKLANEPLDLIICSPLIRAIQTAEIINKKRGIPILIDENLLERDYGELEGCYLKDFDFKNIWSYDNSQICNSGESVKDFFEGLMHFYPSNSDLMKEIIKEHPLEYSNREELVYYMCQIHNILNKKLGKKKFSCKEAFNVWGGDCGCND